MSDVFAVEITSTAVCVALGTQGMRGAKIDRLIVRDLPPPPPASGSAQLAASDAELMARAKPVLSALIAELGLRGKVGTVVVPDRDVYTRLIQFEFDALRRADLWAAVGGELEGMLPLELDEMVFTFDVLPKASTVTGDVSSSSTKPVAGGMRVLAQAMPLADAQGWIDYAEECGFEALSLLSPAGGIAEAFTSKAAAAKPVLLMHLYAGQTEVALVSGGKLIFARSVSRGAADIAQALGGAGGQLGLNEAAFALWLRDVQQTVQACHDKAGISPDVAVLTGQHAAALGQLVGAQLGLPVQALDEVTDTATMPVKAADHLAVVGAALSRGRDKAALELRQGVLGVAADMSFLRAKAGVLVGCFAAILLFAAAAGWAAYYKQNKAFTTLSARAKTESTELFGSAKDPKAIMKEAAGTLATAESPVPKMTAYDIFAKINEQLPGKDKVTLDVSSLEISSDKVTLRGSAKTSDEIDLIDTELKKIKCFSEASRGQTQTGAKGEKTFQLSYKQACM